MAAADHSPDTERVQASGLPTPHRHNRAFWVGLVVMVLSVIIHVYAVIWVKGTLRAMTRGVVSHQWARQNHALWHRQMTEGKK